VATLCARLDELVKKLIGQRRTLCAKQCFQLISVLSPSTRTTTKGPANCRIVRLSDAMLSSQLIPDGSPTFCILQSGFSIHSNSEARET
jgi:hypothetical protein